MGTNNGNLQSRRQYYLQRQRDRSRPIVSLIMCTGGAYPRLLHDRHLNAASGEEEITEHQRGGFSITLQFVRPDIRQSCNLLWALSASASHRPPAIRITTMARPAISAISAVALLWISHLDHRSSSGMPSA